MFRKGDPIEQTCEVEEWLAIFLDSGTSKVLSEYFKTKLGICSLDDFRNQQATFSSEQMYHIKLINITIFEFKFTV